MEATPRLTSEYPIGTEMPILEHICKIGKLGFKGIITRLLDNGRALYAECNECHREIPIDWRTVQNAHHIK